MDKRTQRKEAIKRRDLLSEQDRKRWSDNIREQLIQSDWYCYADVVLSYASFRSEVETKELNQRVLEDGKQLYLPKTYANTRKMKFYPVFSLDSLQKGYQGILEPEEIQPCWEESEKGTNVLLILPGTAYDSEGNRMGYGGGYYDTYLEQYRNQITNCVMLAYQIQEEEKLICETFDQKPDYIISNKKEQEE